MSNHLQPLQEGYYYEHRFCAFCDKRSSEGNFMFCSKCRIVVYCSKEHQVSHWKKHKRLCRKNIWSRENPLGLAAAKECSVHVCACKQWYTDLGSLKNIVDLKSNGYFPPTLPPEIFDQVQTPVLPTSPSLTSEGSSLNGTLSSGTESEAHEMGGSDPRNDSIIGNNTLCNGAIDANPINGLVAHKVGPLVPGNLPEEAQSPTAFPDISALPGSLPPLILHRSHSAEDLENHAPAVCLIPVRNGTESTSCQIVQKSAPLPPAVMCGLPISHSVGQLAELSPDNSSISTERSLQLHPINSCPPSSPSVPLSEMTLVGKDELISSSDNNESIEGKDNKESAWSGASIPFQHWNNMQMAEQTSQQTRLWMLHVWHQVIEDMNRYGVCVVDNLLGNARGAAVLREVQSMYSAGSFQDGQLVKGKDLKDSQSRSIRGDKITWVDGRESHCKNIAVLIKLLDNIVMGANNVGNNGQLGGYRIKERSKAMVACYPGSGTHYVKHVDNPNDDGRIVTAIYYLNKDWDTSENGGLLRIFPEGWSHQVADIEPLFDRVIFFWSDRRNPHEVQPAFKTRYAITLWYFDSNAKARAIRPSAEGNKIQNVAATAAS